MTAEVAILNRSAVALAADSAMTFGPRGDEKIYQINKVFTLSKHHPIGVMIFNSADHMGVPFETIIKMHRASIRDTSQPTVFDYSKNFLTFLQDDIFCTSKQAEINVANILVFWLREKVWKPSQDIIQDEFDQTGKVPKQRISAIIRSNIDREIDELQSFDDCDSLKDLKNPRAIVSRYNKQFDDAVDFTFRHVRVTQSNRNALRTLARLALTKDCFSDYHTGIVFAGFGGDEIFPSLRAVLTEGIIDGKLKYRIDDDIDISRDAVTSAIRAYAQREMVDRFIAGIDPNMEIYVMIMTKKLMEELGKEVVDTYVAGTVARKTAIKNSLRAVVGKYVDTLRQKTHETIRNEFSSGVINAVGNMPKAELAHMAEALVNLTSVKRRVSVEKETVGGPVDVAVISKGDGFVWIKRKHYFPMELNQDFMHKYFM